MYINVINVEAYVYEDRCILRFQEEKNILYKIALTKYGIKKNLKIGRMLQVTKKVTL